MKKEQWIGLKTILNFKGNESAFSMGRSWN